MTSNVIPGKNSIEAGWDVTIPIEGEEQPVRAGSFFEEDLLHPIFVNPLGDF